MAPLPAVATHLLLLIPLLFSTTTILVSGNSWCAARSDASDQALQTALDYACGAGADCAPIQPNGLCFLPNTLPAHASYAFNSYYQRNAMAPGSCDFAGTATVAKTDPSYGSCVYPSSSSAAGGTYTPNMGTSLYPPPQPGATTPVGGGGGLTPGTVVPLVPDTEDSVASPASSVPVIFFFLILCSSSLILMSI